MSKYRAIVMPGYFQIQFKRHWFHRWENFIQVSPLISGLVDDNHKEFINAAKTTVDGIESIKEAEKILRSRL